MFLRVTLVFLAIVSIGLADTLTLRSGQVVRGEYLGGDARHVKMAVADRVETYLVDDVAELQFGSGGRGDSGGGRDNGMWAARRPAPPPREAGPRAPVRPRATPPMTERRGSGR